MMILPLNADEPVAEERQVRVADGADDHRSVLGDERDRVFESVGTPFGACGVHDGGEDRGRELSPGNENAKDDEEGEEDEERGAVEDGEREWFWGERGGGAWRERVGM